MLGLTLGDYCITEAGFGADLGMEKFLDIKCRASSDKETGDRLTQGPDLVVLVVSLRAVKLHGGHDEPGENLEALKVGMKNVQRHCENISKFGLNSIVCINKFPMDTDAEVQIASSMCQGFPSVFKVQMANHWAEGGVGALDLSKAVINFFEGGGSSNFKFLYPPTHAPLQKLETIAKEIYRAEGVVLSAAAQAVFKKNIAGHPAYEKYISQWPVCIAKTQYDFSDDAKGNVAITGKPHTLHVKDFRVCLGARFIVVLCGDIMTMPGLPKKPAAVDVALDANDTVCGLF